METKEFTELTIDEAMQMQGGQLSDEAVWYVIGATASVAGMVACTFIPFVGLAGVIGAGVGGLLGGALGANGKVDEINKNIVQPVLEKIRN